MYSTTLLRIGWIIRVFAKVLVATMEEGLGLPVEGRVYDIILARASL